jgi:benzylsuccinate CoA-transferase BbsF subunit
MIALSLQGQTGSRAEQPGIGPHVQMRSGLDDITGFPDAVPGGPSVFLPDLMGPWVGLSGVLAAIEERRQTGVGQYIDLSQYESMLMWMQPALLERQLTGQSPQRRGNASNRAAPHGTFPVAGDDRWIAIACESDEEWANLWELLPPDLQTRFARGLPLAERLEACAAIEDALAAWTRDQDGVELMERLQAAGVPAYVVSDPYLLYHDAQLAHRGHFVMADHAYLEQVPVETAAFRTDGWDFPELVSGPLYASGTAEVLTEWLDMGDDEIADLVADSVITFE